jgi:hypothetical protein
MACFWLFWRANSDWQGHSKNNPPTGEIDRKTQKNHLNLSPKLQQLLARTYQPYASL